MAYKTEVFERRKIELAVKSSGILFEFFRNKKNDFGEPVGEPEKITEIQGVYHTNTSYISVKNGDSGAISNKKIYTPCILCLADSESEKIKQGDYTTVNGKKIVVTGKVDYQEKKYAFDINCEVVKDG